ncbi:hypothetical protein ZIOFF_038429 [Zingiber officinale]|uniref:Ubiquitin-like protease family profile domain-containing protein n=1 Tax=Zingiber officinale TaxID=94328 RepID=A0A8J5GEL8_ZINOF|nr:hypothetical protein ZIOFF_038429 [Zingiber officinale]
MAKQPIKIDWETVLPEMRDNGPPLEVEVVAMVASEVSDVANLADHALLESIQRLKKHLSSEIRSRLSDGGAKLKALLCQMDEERNRRDRVRDPEDTGSCDATTQSKNMEYPVKDHSENPIQSKFASKFIEKLEGKADAAFDEDLNVINQGKANGYGENELHKNERGHRFIITSQKTKHSSKQTPFKCVGRFKLRSFSDEHEDPCSSRRPKENYYNYKRSNFMYLKDENFTLLVYVKVVLAVSLTKLFHYQNRRGQLGNGFLLAQSTAAAPSRKILMVDNASETSGISANPMSSSGQVQPVFTMAGTGGSGLQIVSEKLSETNYASWAVAVELYVEGHDKLDILHGTKVKPDEKDPSFRTWQRDNIQLMTWMLNSVNSGIKQVILHNKTAYDMWKTLEQMYGRRHDMLRTYQISSQIFKLEQGSKSVTNYFATLKGLWDEFDYYRMENWSSTDDHQRYLKLLEKDRIIKFLDGLTAEFESLKGQILGLDPTPSLEQVYYKILSEEGRKRTMNNKGISTGGPPIGETSVFIGSANKFRPRGTKRQGDKFCQHCKRTNYDSYFCWEKYPEKKPEKFKHNAKKTPNSSNIAIQKLESEETIGSSVSSITGLSSTDIVNLQHLLSRLQASSSASTPADSTPFQAHTDGTKATVAGKGSIKLTDHFFLSSALHVPSDLETKQTIGTGREVGGLYYYQLETTSALKSAAKLVVPQVVSSPIPLDVIENKKDAPSLGKDAPSLGAQSSPDIITYKRRRHEQEPPMDRLVESDALAPDPVKQLSSSVEPTAPLNMNELDLSVVVRKGVRSCTQHPISNHVSYSRLSPSYHAFVSQLSNHAIPSSYYEAIRDSRWQEAMNEEMEALNRNGTWELVDPPKGKNLAGSRDDRRKMAIVYYPSREDPESVQLSYSDIACLEPKSYLTSSIMNFYIRYLQMSLSLVDRPKERYHFFNTYFYKKLEEAISPKANKEFEKLRRWWKGVNIFQKSYIFIPVHRDMHWSLVIICIPAKEDESGPIVLHLDSLGIHSSHLIFEVIDR